MADTGKIITNHRNSVSSGSQQSMSLLQNVDEDNQEIFEKENSSKSSFDERNQTIKNSLRQDKIDNTSQSWLISSGVPTPQNLRQQNELEENQKISKLEKIKSDKIIKDAVGKDQIINKALVLNDGNSFC